MRRRLFIAALIPFGIVLICVGLFGPIFASFPAHQGPRIGGDDVVGIDAGGAYVWVVETKTGVVLIDAGLDPEAEAVRAEIGDRPLHAVLITHGHLDHIAGLQGLPAVPVFVGPGETDLVRGEAQAKGRMQRWFSPMIGTARPPPGPIRALGDGQLFAIDGVPFRSYHLPGHTAGSMAFLYDDVLFTGDALLGHGDHVAPTHAAFADDYDQNVTSIAKLRDLAYTRIADGHAGLHPDAKPQIRRFIEDNPPAAGQP